MQRIFRSCAAVWLVTGSVVLHSQSAPIPLGPQFQVNSWTTGRQAEARIESNSDGGFVVVWRTSSSGHGLVQGQRFSPDGLPLGSEFAVNSVTTNVTRPTVALDLQGRILVVWSGRGAGGDDADIGVQGRLLDPSGIAQGPQFQINSYTTSLQNFPSVAARADGEFVVVWTSLGSWGGDQSLASIQGQRLDQDGELLGEQFQVNTFTTWKQALAEVVAANSGDFVVGWQSGVGLDENGFAVYEIRARRFLADATPVGGDFQVANETSFSLERPSVASSADGGFVVAWDRDDVLSLRGRRFAADGSPVADEFSITDQYGSNGGRGEIDLDGEFVAVWSRWTSPSHAFGRRFAEDGTPLGPEFQVNSYTTNFQEKPDVSIDPSGDFVVAFESSGSTGTDQDGWSVQARRFRVTGDLQGQAFHDLDGNGVRGAGEPGLVGVGIELYDETQTLRRSTVTDGAGDYFLKPKEGDWTVKFVPPGPAYTFTVQDAGGDDTLDSDADPGSGVTAPFSIAINVLENSIDVGMLLQVLFVDGFESGDVSAWSPPGP